MEAVQKHRIHCQLPVSRSIMFHEEHDVSRHWHPSPSPVGCCSDALSCHAMSCHPRPPQVPTDGLIVFARSLAVNESSLTGESELVRGRRGVERKSCHLTSRNRRECSSRPSLVSSKHLRSRKFGGCTWSCFGDSMRKILGCSSTSEHVALMCGTH